MHACLLPTLCTVGSIIVGSVLPFTICSQFSMAVYRLMCVAADKQLCIEASHKLRYGLTFNSLHLHGLIKSNTPILACTVPIITNFVTYLYASYRISSTPYHAVIGSIPFVQNINYRYSRHANEAWHCMGVCGNNMMATTLEFCTLVTLDSCCFAYRGHS